MKIIVFIFLACFAFPILRIIALQLKKSGMATNQFGRGLDASIALKVVGEESDGGIVILWKCLKVRTPRATLKP